MVRLSGAYSHLPLESVSYTHLDVYKRQAYTPVSNNAAAFNVTMDREPIQEGKYEGNSTMKR